MPRAASYLSFAALFTTLQLLVPIAAHGLLAEPAPRKAGAAFKDKCGAAISAVDAKDPAGQIELLQAAGKPTSADCDLAFCRGYQMADVEPATVHAYKTGSTIKWRYSLTIPHAGQDPVSLSIHDAKTKAPLAKDIFTLPSMGAKAGDVPISWKVPTGLDTKCKVFGDCVAQLSWASTGKPLTYLACVDVVITAP